MGRAMTCRTPMPRRTDDATASRFVRLRFCAAWGSPRRWGCAGDFGTGQGEGFSLNLRTAKQVADLYLVQVANRTWRRILDGREGADEAPPRQPSG